jgi:hypothetical protein
LAELTGRQAVIIAVNAPTSVLLSHSKL